MEHLYKCFLAHVLRSLLYGCPSDALAMFGRKNHIWSILASTFDKDELDVRGTDTSIAVAELGDYSTWHCK